MTKENGDFTSKEEKKCLLIPMEDDIKYCVIHHKKRAYVNSAKEATTVTLSVLGL